MREMQFPLAKHNATLTPSPATNLVASCTPAFTLAAVGAAASNAAMNVARIPARADGRDCTMYMNE